MWVVSVLATAVSSAALAAEVLHDQYKEFGGVGVVSQNFETDYDDFDSQAADDFQVPSGTRWYIREVDVAGSSVFATGSENLFFYRGGRLPNKVIAEFDE